MLDWTTPDARYFLRLCAPHTLLYTEMVTSGAVCRGDAERHLRFHPAEHPVAVQFGGSEPEALARCAAEAERYGYDEVNLNVGCPSDRVQSGRFGACLMAEPELVASCVAAMRAASSLPVTVKTRIGIDHQDDYSFLRRLVDAARDAGCTSFIIHARKAWLSGLSPKENREIPPLDYSRVYRLKQDYPQLEIVINGGVRSLDEIREHLRHVDGVMIGREAYGNPYALAQWDAAVFGRDDPLPSRHELVRRYLPYIEQRLARGARLASMTRHILGLFQGLPGARGWRRYLSEHAPRAGAGVEVVEAALAQVPEQAAEVDAAG